jgi:uncharacterized membrane protein
MPAAQRKITIDRPVDQVFDFFTDHGNDQKWRRHVKEIDPKRQSPVGTTIHQVVSGPGGRGIPSDIEVTANEPPSRYAFRVVAGPVRPVGELTFTPSGTGTEVSMSLSAELSGIKKVFMARAVQKSMDAEVGALDTAKRLIEAS